MNSYESALPSASAGTHAPTSTAGRRRAVYCHKPYSAAILIIPSPTDGVMQRVVYSTRSPMLHQRLPSSVCDDTHSITGLTATPNYASHHPRRATLSSISMESIEGPVTPSSTGRSGAICRLNSIVMSIDEAEKPPKEQRASNLLTARTSTAAPTCSSHCGSALPPSLCKSTTVPAGGAVDVAFKYGTRRFLATFALEVGEPVVVEGDRGIDLGYVQRGMQTQRHDTSDFPRVLRRPTVADEEMHRQRFRDEARALQRLREACATSRSDSTFTSEAVRDVMLQLDRKKITIIISRESNKHVFDFRSFQRQVFDMYRCRVWFSYLDEICKAGSTDNKKPARSGRGAAPGSGKRKGRSSVGASSEKRASRSNTSMSSAALPASMSH